MTLAFDDKKVLKELGSALVDVLEAGGAFAGFTEVNLEGMSFPNLTPAQQKAAPKAAADLANLQKDYGAAQGHAVTWVNEIEPQITKLPQAYINMGTWVSTWKTESTQLSHQAKIDVLQSTSDKLGAAAKTLNDFAATVLALQQKITTDADNFSKKHAAYAELEALDGANLKATTTALEKIKTLIMQENETINVDLLNADKNLEIAITVMDAGDKAGNAASTYAAIAEEGEGVGEFIQMVTSIIGVVLIGVAEKQISEALATIEQRLKNAEKKDEYQINFTQLTVQLVALHTANSTLAKLSKDVADVHQVFSDAGKWFLACQKEVDAIIAADAPAADVTPFALNSYAKSWETLQTAGSNWQLMEVEKPKTVPIHLANFDPKYRDFKK